MGIKKENILEKKRRNCTETLSCGRIIVLGNNRDSLNSSCPYYFHKI